MNLCLVSGYRVIDVRQSTLKVREGSDVVDSFFGVAVFVDLSLVVSRVIFKKLIQMASLCSLDVINTV